MNKIINVLKFLWEWIRIGYVKTRQTLCLMHELMRPGKSWTHRIGVAVLVLIIIAFVINSFVAFWSTSIQMVADKQHQCESDLAAMKAISDATLEDLDVSSDTIKADAALDYLMERLKKHKPTKDSYVCLVDTSGNVLKAETQDWPEKMDIDGDTDSLTITTEGMEPLALDLGNIQQIGNASYMMKSLPIWHGQWRVVMLHNAQSTWGTIVELFLKVTKSCLISIMLAIIGFMSMFLIMKHALISRRNIEGEMDIAANIQQQMLPKSFPTMEDVDMYGFLRPAKAMGGDLYDYLLRDGKLFFCLGDVSGKGMPAALLMSEVHSLFRNVARHTYAPDEIAAAINVSVAEGNDSNMFCTLFVGVLDIATKMLTYCNAGHNAPVIMHNGAKPEYLDVIPNLAVGLFGDFIYQPQQLQMNNGMSLFVYTDGVTEAEDALSRLFSDEALLQGLTECPPASTSKEMVEHVLELVDHHARFADQSDDITMMCVRYI